MHVIRAMSTRQKIGAAVVAVIVGFALLGPATGSDPLRQDLNETLSPPSAAHPLGTDHLGRSALARLSWAAGLSLALAVVSVLTAAIPGTAIGILAAWRGGWLEASLVAIADSVLALPALLLIVLLTAFAPGELWPLYLGLSLAFWVEYFRVVRASSRALLAGPQVEASRLLGFGPAYVVRRHLLPEIAPLLGTLMVFGVATAIVSLATLGFIGVGLRPPMPELGLIMIEVLPYYQEAPWLIGAPVGLLAAAVVGLGLLTAGYRR